MKEKRPGFDQAGQNGAPEPQSARASLAWLEALAGCNSQEELAQRTKLDSRTLRRFAAGQGGRKTGARLVSEVSVSWYQPQGSIEQPDEPEKVKSEKDRAKG